MEFQYHISEMTAETAAADFVKEFVQVEKFLLACQQCPNSTPAGRAHPSISTP